MKQRKKILVLEKDDFLREIIGNLLHKKGGYLLSAFSITEGIENARGHHIDTIILGTSCPEYKGKETLSYIKKELGQQHINFYMINHENQELDFVDADSQMKVEKLSVQKIIDDISVYS